MIPRNSRLFGRTPAWPSVLRLGKQTFIPAAQPAAYLRGEIGSIRRELRRNVKAKALPVRTATPGLENVRAVTRARLFLSLRGRHRNCRRTRQMHAEGRAAPGILFCPDSPSMLRQDRAANCQSQAGSAFQ